MAGRLRPLLAPTPASSRCNVQERLQKILARGGVSSRRAAETLIREGRVRVNGQVVTELGSKADPVRDKIEVGAVRVQREDFVYYVLHKPRGVVSTLSDPENRPTIKDLLPRGAERLYPVGRLDFHTSGVLLITNDGDFANALLHPKKDVPKTYVVKVQGEMKERDLDQWRNGVNLEDGKTKPAKVSLLRYEAGKTWFEVTITEGRNQQIRRMGEATGYPVMRLARLEFAGVGAEGLGPGACRMLTRDELKALKRSHDVPKRISADHPIRTEVIRPMRARASKYEEHTKHASTRTGSDDRVERAPRGSYEEREDRGPREDNRRGRPAVFDSRTPARETRTFDSRTPARETRAPRAGARETRETRVPRAGARDTRESGGRSNQQRGRSPARPGQSRERSTEASEPARGGRRGARAGGAREERDQKPAAGFRRSHGEKPPAGPKPSTRGKASEGRAPAERPAPRGERGWETKSKGGRAASPKRTAGNKNKDREPKASEERPRRKP